MKEAIGASIALHRHSGNLWFQPSVLGKVVKKVMGLPFREPWRNQSQFSQISSLGTVHCDIVCIVGNQIGKCDAPNAA